MCLFHKNYLWVLLWNGEVAMVTALAWLEASKDAKLKRLERLNAFGRDKAVVLTTFLLQHLGEQ